MQVESTTNAINIEWEALKSKQKKNREMLQKQLKYLEFVQRVQNHTVWIQNLDAHFEKLEISTELPVIEAQTLQHNEHYKGIQAKNEELNDMVQLSKVIFGIV